MWIGKVKKIFILIGKSSTGKDTIYQKLLESQKFQTIVPYTTRPIRKGEQNGREYFFISEEEYLSLKKQNKIIESRCYQTVYGPWYYMTVDDGQFQKKEKKYLMIGTIESFLGLKHYFSEDKVIPIYIKVKDKERLLRSIERESRQQKPGYLEVCRRFLEDEKDFTKEKLREAGIEQSFENNILQETVDKILKYMETTA